MPPLADKQRLADVSFADIEEASATRNDALKMLAHLVAIARPKSGAATLLVATAHLASAAWLRGALRARFRVDGATTVYELVEDLGGGHRVPLFHASVDVGLDELFAVLPHLPLRPLRLVRQAEDALVLGVSLRGSRDSIEPPPPSVMPPAIRPTPVPDPEPPAAEEIDESW